MNRYPHTATITVTTEVDNGTGIPTITTEDLVLVGRYEPAPKNSSLDYSAKFFCREKISLLDEDPFALDGQTLKYGGRSIGIAQAWNYQSHCELWLD